ncbi:MAG TPA: ComF family protein [Solimonas sp.]
MRLWVDKTLAQAGRWLTPARCQYCRTGTDHLPICADCTAGLPWNQTACPLCALPQTHTGACRRCARRAPPFDAAWCAFRMEAPIQQGIHGLKYHARFLQARMLGTLMAQALSQRAGRPELLIPVPLHRGRLFWRGYNQALEIARTLAAESSLQLDADAVRRVRATADQIGTRAAQRRRNVRGAFEAMPRLHGRRIALLDDVMTTGATLGELARVCRAAGAIHIEAWAVARVA